MSKAARVLPVVMIICGLGVAAISCTHEAHAYPVVQCRAESQCFLVDDDFVRDGLRAPAPAVQLASFELDATPELPPVATPPVPEDSTQLVLEVAALARSGSWLAAIGGALILIMRLLAMTRVRELALFKGDRGGAILLSLISFLGIFGASLYARTPLDLKTFAGALVATWVAAGGYTWIRRIIWPKDDAAPAGGR